MSNPRSLSPDDALRYMKSGSELEFIGDEKKFEAHICLHLKEIFEAIGLSEIKLIKRQLIIKRDAKCIFDIFVLHADGSISILEVKNSYSTTKKGSIREQCLAIGQLLLYKSMLESYEDLKKIRLFLVDNKIYPRTVSVIVSSSLPITLMQLNHDMVLFPYFNCN